jgi:hypothetical protein
VDAVFDKLPLRHLLEEQPWAVPVRILDRRSCVALLLRYADPGEEVVPRGQRVGVLGQVDSWRAGVHITQCVAQKDDSARGSWPSKLTWMWRLIGLLPS